MKLDQLRDYLTMPEVALKWKATDPEMCRAVLKGLLRPSVYLDEALQPAEVTQAGSIQRVERQPERVQGWYYVAPILQIGALDCKAQTVTVVQDVLPGAAMWVLREALTMRELMKDAV